MWQDRCHHLGTHMNCRKIILAIITINYYNKVKLFGSTKRTECLEQASAEASVTTQSIVSRLVMQIESLKRKQEATTF